MRRGSRSDGLGGMGSNHGRRRALGRGVSALVACAVVTMTGLVTGAAASGALGGTPASPQGNIMLTSVGTDNVPATAPNARAAISENGRYVAFQSQATLTASSSVIPPPTPPAQPGSPPPPSSPVTIPTTTCCSIQAKPLPSASATAPSPAASPSDVAPAAAPRLLASQQSTNWRVYVRDQTGNATSLLSNPNLGNATAPDISGDGKLVSYLFNDGTENNVFVVNRQATGTGPFDTTANLAVKQVTGMPNDLQFQRILGCPDGIDPKGAARTTPCGPKLSADGSTLVYPAQLSPISPELSVSAAVFENQVAVTGNVIDDDFVGPGQSFTFNVSYTVTGSQPVTIKGFTVTGPFALATGEGSQDTCTGGTFQPGTSCVVTVQNLASACSEGSATTVTGALQTDSPVPDGQSSVALALFCNPFESDDAKLSHPVTSLLASGGCAAAPNGLPVEQAPATEQDNDDNSLVDFGPTVIGQPFTASVSFSVANQDPVQFVSPDCGFQLTSPASCTQTAGGGQTCTLPASACSETDGGQDCTAQVLVSPGSVGTDVASFIGVANQTPEAGPQAEVDTYLSVTGLSNVVVARHDKTGAGNFAASPSTVVSVDGNGTVIPDASQPSVSATGRYVAFAAPVQGSPSVDTTTEVWRHDTDAAGNGTGQPGPTPEVSCTGSVDNSCLAATDADSPSISGDGSQVAFATVGGNGQVYAWNVTTDTATLVSAPASGAAGAIANGDSYAPAMSQDGSTVAYISTATDLAAPATVVRAANLYMRTLTPHAPVLSELVSQTGGSLPAGDDIALPAVDGHGGLVAFQTSAQLVSQAPPAVTSIYTFEAEPALSFAPAPVDFGSLPKGSKPATLTVTVTDTGPGPGTVTSAGTTGPFGETTGACAGAVLHDGGSCVLTVSFVPNLTGTATGTLTSTATDELGSPATFSVPVTAFVPSRLPPPNPRLTVDPGVAPPGQVTFVTGTGFVLGERLMLSWDHGLGQVAVTVIPDGGPAGTGGFKAVMVIFADGFTGPRLLEASDLTSTVVARADFLAQQPSPMPPIAPFGTDSGPAG